MSAKKNNIFTELLCGKLFPLLLIVVMACTYATQIPEMGFYLDDWVSIAAYDQGGEAGLIAFGINDSRPFSAWVTAKFFSVLGTGTLQWQLITVFWRFAAALTCFALLCSIWPKQRQTAGIISLIFGVFPYFSHQPICIAYFMILMQYFIILLSFLFTVKALQAGKQSVKILLFLLSYLTSIFHLACLEYYLSLEAARIVVIFIVLKNRDGNTLWKTVKKTILIYIPYALILIAILAYRFIYIPSLSTDVRPVELLTKYSGLSLVLHLIQLAANYLTESLLGVWYNSIDPVGVDFNIRHTQLALGLGVIAAVAVFIVLRKSFDRKVESTDNSASKEMILLGAAAMLLGFFPGMAIDSPPASTSIYSDRYLIPSFWGISIFIVSFLSAFLRSKTVQNILFSIMIFIAVFFQIQNAYAYRYSWKSQQQFQWELKWRVPDLEKNTAVVGDGVVALFMGGWADGSMLNEMYGKNEGIDPTPYWYFNIGEDNYLYAVGTDDPIYIKSKMYEFRADSDNILAVTKPEYGRCLWVLDEADIDNPYLDAGIRPYIKYQNRSRINLDSDYIMPASVFGSDYTHNWCYYFEKADLALDMGDYGEALRLFEEASANGYHPGNAVEMRPFIKAAAYSGDWEKALEWSEYANELASGRTNDYFENLWSLMDRDTEDSVEKNAVLTKARGIFH